MNYRLELDIPEASTFVSGDKVFGHQADGNARVWDRDLAAGAARDRLGVIYVTTEAELIAAIAQTVDLGETYPFGPIIQLPYGTISMTDTLTISSRHSFVLRGFGSEASVLSWTGVDMSGKDAIVLERCTKARLQDLSIWSANPATGVTGGIVFRQTPVAQTVGLESEDNFLSHVGFFKCEKAVWIDSTQETGDPQNGFHKLFAVTTNGKYGVYIESTAAYQIICDNVTCSGNSQWNKEDTIGLYGVSSNYWSWYNGQGSSQGDDFRLGSASNRGPMIIEGHRSELSQVFIADDNSTIRDDTVNQSSLSIKNVTWDGQPRDPLDYAVDAHVDTMTVDAVDMNPKLGRTAMFLGGTATIAAITGAGEAGNSIINRRNNSGGTYGFGPRDLSNPYGPDYERSTLTLPKTSFAAGETSDLGWPFTHGDVSSAITADASTDLFLNVAGAHGLNDENTVRLITTDTLPSPLTEKTVYWVKKKDSDEFYLATSRNGSTIDVTDTGTGTHTWIRHDLLRPFTLAFDWTPSDLTAAAGYANRHSIVKITGVEMLGQTGDLCLSIGGDPLVMSVQYDSGSALSVPSLTLADPGWAVGETYRVVFVYDAGQRIYQLICRVGNGTVGKAGGIDNTGTLGADDGELRPLGERIPIYPTKPAIVIGGGLFAGTIANGSYWDRPLVDSEVEKEAVGGTEPTDVTAL